METNEQPQWEIEYEHAVADDADYDGAAGIDRSCSWTNETGARCELHAGHVGTIHMLAAEFVDEREASKQAGR